MKNLIILFFTVILFTACGKDDEGSGPKSNAYLLKFTLDEVEYIKAGKMPGELAYYGKYGKEEMENFVLNIGGALNHDASVAFILSTDQTGDVLHYKEFNITHLHSFTIAFDKPGSPGGVIYYADNNVTITISERTLPTTIDNGKIRGTFSGTFSLAIDGIKQEGKEAFITGSFNIGY